MTKNSVGKLGNCCYFPPMLYPSLFGRAIAIASLLAVSLLTAQAQIVIDGVTDKANYNDTVSYRVQAQAGFQYEAYLNAQPVTVGVFNTITRPDYYELYVVRTEIATDDVVTRMVRFLVNASSRGGSEWGLPPHVPLPLVQSSPEEFTGARLRILVPQAFPAGYEIPVVAWAVDEGNHAVRANGLLTAAGQNPVQLRRGVGSGFLGSNSPAGTLAYMPALAGIVTNKPVTIESGTTWTSVSGTLAGATVWPAQSRIRVTGHIEIPAGSSLSVGAGSVVLLDAGVNITNDGALIITGTVEQPVVFMPHSRNQPWGGFFMRNSSGSVDGTGVIFVASGADPNGGAGHRREQCLFLVDNNPSIQLTDSAAIYLAGQLGHAYDGGTFTYTRFLMQRATTGGEYTGASFTVTDSAFIECPDDTANFVDGDNDGLYIIGGNHAFTNTLFGWVKDDGIDSGGTDSSGNYARINYQSCWFEAAFHEGNSLSGYKNITVRDTVYLNCGQGIEDGYNAPTARVDRCYFALNKSGARHGDNYPSIGNYDGRLTVTNSILLQNHRDLFGYNWRSSGFTNSSDRFFANNNFLTRPDTNFPNNAVWNPATDAARLSAFGAAGRVGVALAVRPGQTALTNFPDGIPVLLSKFSTNTVSVDYEIHTSSGGVQSGTLLFRPGEMRHYVPTPANLDGVARVLLTEPQNADLTGASELWFQSFTPLQTTPLVPLGSVWKFRDTASAPDTAWRSLGYDDSTWRSGPAELGFGENDQVTLVASNRQVTTYFRHTFTVENPAQFAGLAMRLRRDDAGVVHINGVEAYRSPNLPPSGSISYTNFATSNGENTIDTATIPASRLQPGLNVVAVEIHQGDITSSDLSFDFELIGQPLSGTVRLEIARFGDATALYWREPAYRLQQTPGLAPTNWTTLPGSSPLPLLPEAPQYFYRLTR